MDARVIPPIYVKKLYTDMKLVRRFEDLTLKQYIELNDLDSTKFDSDPLFDAMDRAVKKLSIISGLSVDKIESMHRNDIMTYLARTNFVNDPPKEFGFKTALRFGFKKYTATLDLSDMTPAQMIDFMNLSKAGAPVNDLLAVMYVRGKYDPAKHPYVSSKILEQKVGHCLGLFFFYSAYLKRCEPIIAAFLENSAKEIQEIVDEITTDKGFMASLSIGDGSIM